MDISHYIDKCRFCFGQVMESAHDIEAELFYSVFGRELIISPKLSSVVCRACHEKLTQFHSFKRDVTIKQEQLYSLLSEDEPTAEEEAQEHPSPQKPPSVERTRTRICPECGKVVKGNNHLNFHIRTKHLKLTKFQCDLCGFRSYGKYEIRAHMLVRHLPLEARREHKCDQCPAALTTAMSLRTHKTHKHSGLRPFSCAFCERSYALKQTLTAHIRSVHHGERRHRCVHCGRGYNSSHRLTDHVNNAHGAKQAIPCDKCGKVFSSMRNLNTHAIYHASPRLKCPHCERRFHVAKSLREHLASVHLGVTHACETCHRTFQSTSGLRRHVKTHCK